MALAQLIATETGIDEIGTYLDGLDHEARWAELSALSRKQQRTLYDRAADSTPITLDHFVPEDKAPLEPVIHHGRNTLPLLPQFKFFQKVFCKPKQDAEQRLFGFNESPARFWIGPGFFCAVSTESNEDWVDRGEIVVDYFQVPDGEVPEGWPRVVPNSYGPQMFVYNRTRDFMRRVSDHVSIGAAYKVESKLDHYFVLCREDA